MLIFAFRPSHCPSQKKSNAKAHAYRVVTVYPSLVHCNHTSHVDVSLLLSYLGLFKVVKFESPKTNAVNVFLYVLPFF